MKKITLLFLLLIPYFGFSQANLIHDPHSYVDDFANIISPADKAELQQDILDFKKTSKVEISIVTVPDLQGKEIDEFTNQLFRQWGVGSKANTGVMILVSQNPRKIRTEVGYGLEGYLTDANTKILTDSLAVPLFKQGNFGEGLKELLKGYLAILDPSAIELKQAAIRKNAEISNQRKENIETFLLRCLGGIITIVILAFFAIRRRKKSKEKKDQLYSAFSEYGSWEIKLNAYWKKIMDNIKVPGVTDLKERIMAEYSAKNNGQSISDIHVAYSTNSGSAEDYVAGCTRVEALLKKYYNDPVYLRIDRYLSIMELVQDFMDKNSSFLDKASANTTVLQKKIDANSKLHPDFWEGVSYDLTIQASKYNTYYEKIQAFIANGTANNIDNFDQVITDTGNYVRWLDGIVNRYQSTYNTISSYLDIANEKIKGVENYKTEFQSIINQMTQIIHEESYISELIIADVPGYMKTFEVNINKSDNYSTKWGYYVSAKAYLANLLGRIQSLKTDHYSEIERLAAQERREAQEAQDRITQAAAAAYIVSSNDDDDDRSSSSSWSSSDDSSSYSSSDNSFSGGDSGGGGSDSSY